MNIKKNFLSAFALGLSLFAFLTAVAFGQTETTRNQFTLYGMHFINGGQSLRLSVQNPRFSDSEVIPCLRVRVVFDVYEQSSTEPVRLRFARRVSREILLDGGEAATFEFRASQAGDYVSPMVFGSPGDVAPPDMRPERLVSTLVVRQGERTILNLPAVLKGFDPQPDPPTE